MLIYYKTIIDTDKLKIICDGLLQPLHIKEKYREVNKI